MALRRALGWSEGEVMRPESKPCSRLMRQTAGIFSVGGGLAFWVLCRLHYGHYSCPSNHLLFFFCTIIRILSAVLVEFPRCASPLDQPRTRTILLTLCIFCRSENNSSKESQVGVMWSSLCERVNSLACAALQPRMWTSEYSSIWQTWIEAWIASLFEFRVSRLSSIMFFLSVHPGQFLEDTSAWWRDGVCHILSLEFVLLATIVW